MLVVVSSQNAPRSHTSPMRNFRIGMSAREGKRAIWAKWTDFSLGIKLKVPDFVQEIRHFGCSQHPYVALFRKWHSHLSVSPGAPSVVPPKLGIDRRFGFWGDFSSHRRSLYSPWKDCRVFFFRLWLGR